MLSAVGLQKKYLAKISAESQYEKPALYIILRGGMHLTGPGSEASLAQHAESNETSKLLTRDRMGWAKKLRIIRVFHCVTNITGPEIERGTKLEGKHLKQYSDLKSIC
jgi:hypothetical protein